MKKYLLFLALVAFIGGRAFSQTALADTSKSHDPKSEIRIDLNYFLDLFKNQTNLPSTTLFSLSGCRFLSEKTFLRIDLGAGYSSSNTKKDTVPKSTYTDVEQSYGIGLGRETKISKRFAFFYGGEALLQPTYNKTEQPLLATSGPGFVIQTNTVHNTYYGASAFMGFKLFLFSRISLSTETFVNFLFLNTINSTTYDITPAQNTRSTTKGFNTTYYLPSTIYINILLGK